MREPSKKKQLNSRRIVEAKKQHHLDVGELNNQEQTEEKRTPLGQQLRTDAANA